MELDRLIRKVEDITGCSITLTSEEDGPVMAVACDPELDRIFQVPVVYPSRAKAAIKILHSLVYRSRSEDTFRIQKGKCALCGGHMTTYEIDHKISRGQNGRDDRMSNLRAVHPSPCHRERHGG